MIRGQSAVAILVPGRRRILNEECFGEPPKPTREPRVLPDRAERSPFLGEGLFAGSPGCGDDLVEALITAQRIPAWIEAEIAVCRASRNRRDNFELLEHVAVTLPIELKRPLSTSAFVFLF